MKAITIPKEYSKKDDLVVIPRKEYQKLVELREFYIGLDQDLDEAVSEYRKGGYDGPFGAIEEGRMLVRDRVRKKSRR